MPTQGGVADNAPSHLTVGDMSTSIRSHGKTTQKVFKLGTFNVRGLSKDVKQTQLSNDMTKYKMDVMCIQETKMKELINKDIGKNRLLCTEAETELDLRNIRVKALNRSHWQKIVRMVTDAAHSDSVL